MSEKAQNVLRKSDKETGAAASPILRYSRRGQFAHFYEARWRQTIIALNGLLFGLLVLVLWHSGYYEPFFEFEASQAFVQLGCGLLGLLLALSILVWAIFGVAKAALAKLWLLAGVWAGLQMLVLLFAVVGYLSDLLK